jgi:hypothetical protein
MTDKIIRLYNDSYLPMGFTWTGDENFMLPMRNVGGEKTMKYGYGPSKVKLALHN